MDKEYLISQYKIKYNFSSTLLFIPFLNYLFWLYQMRGGYFIIKNYFFFNNKLPSFINSVVSALKFCFFSSIRAILIFLLLLLLGLNPLGELITFFFERIELIIEGYSLYVPYEFYSFYNIIDIIESTQINLFTIMYNALFIIISYFLFAFIGLFLGVINAKIDARQKYIPYY